MKILVINAYYYPHMVGGAEHSVQILCENLIKEGHEVYVYSIDGTFRKSFDIEKIHGVTVYRGYAGIMNKIANHLSISTIDHINGRILCYHNHNSQKQLKYLINQIHPDIIHTQNLLSISYWIWNYASKKGIKVVHTLRDYWLIDPKTVLNQSNKYLDAIHQHILRKVSNRNSIIVTSPSKATIQIFDQYGYFKKSRKFCIVNCVDFNEDELNENISAAMQKTGNQINFIFVGTLGKHKGIDVLLKAFTKAINPDITLTICGSGELEGYVKKCCRDDQRIQYLGQLKKNELVEHYKKADAIIVPSVWEEPFGRIVIEGAKYGLPCIGSNKGGIPEIINTLQDGIIFDPKRTDKLVEAIKIFSNRDKLKSYLPAIKKNLHKYSSAEQTEAFLKIYQDK